LAMSQAMAGCGISWHTHDPGVVLTHLAVAIADGADCLSDMAVLREQDELFAPVASHATAWRAVGAVASAELRGIARAAAIARAQVWVAAGGPDTLTLDFDATLVTGPFRQAGRGPDLQAHLRLSPTGGVVGRNSRAVGGQRRCQRRRRPRAAPRRGRRRAPGRPPGRPPARRRCRRGPLPDAGAGVDIEKNTLTVSAERRREPEESDDIVISGGATVASAGSCSSVRRSTARRSRRATKLAC
jgi:hypothetical protein